MRTRTFFFVLLALVAIASRAEAKHVRFLGAHPIAAKFGGGYCYIEAPHMHIYGPDRPALYQQVGDDYVFTGDPTPFGYDGDRHPFYGHHPVVVDGAPEPVYCLIDGPHFHPYAAPSTPEYRVKDGVAFYVSPIPATYVRPARVRVVNAEYRPYVSFRPTVEVAPPPEWHGEVYVAGPGIDVRGPSVEVRGPGVFVPPPPRVSVEVSGPGVFVAPPSPHVIVGGPRVVVGAPGPVFVGAPGPVFVGEPRGRFEHHDNGRHEGWGEHHDNGRHEGWDKGHGEHGRGHH